MPLSSHWPPLKVLDAAVEKAPRPVVPPVQLSQWIISAIEEGSFEKVKELFATHPHALQTNNWETVMRAALKHFDLEIFNLLDQQNPPFAPFLYIEQLKEKCSAPLFNAFMKKLESPAFALMFSQEGVLRELWEYAIKEFSNPTRAANARRVRAAVLEKAPSIAQDPTHFDLYVFLVNGLVGTSLNHLTPEDHQFLEGLPSFVKTRYTQMLFESSTVANLSIQQLHQVCHFLDQHPSYLQQLRCQEKRNQQQQQDIHALWRSIVPPGAHFWKDTHIRNFSTVTPTTRIVGRIHGSIFECSFVGKPELEEFLQPRGDKETDISLGHGSIFECSFVGKPGLEDFLDKGVWPCVDKETDIRLGLDLFDEMIVYAPNFEVLAEQRSTDGQTKEVVFGGDMARAYDWWTTVVMRSSPAIRSLTHTPQFHECVDHILADKSKRLGWALDLTPPILEELCNHRSDLKQWTDEHGNTLLHYIFSLNTWDPQRFMEFAAIHPQWVETRNINGVSVREIAAQRGMGADIDQQLEKMLLSLHVQHTTPSASPSRKI